MKILDCERDVPVSTAVLLMTEHEALGLMGTLNWMFGHPGQMAAALSDEFDEDGHMVLMGLHGREGDDLPERYQHLIKDNR